MAQIVNAHVLQAKFIANSIPFVENASIGFMGRVQSIIEEFGKGATYGGQFDGGKTFWFRAQSLLTSPLLLLSAMCERL